MRRITAFAGCLTAGLIVFLAGPPLRAGETPAGLQGLHSSNIPVLLASVPYIPPSRPSVPSVPRVSVPRVSVPKQTAPKQTAPKQTAPKQTAPKPTPQQKPATQAPTPRPSAQQPATRPSTQAPTPRPANLPPTARPSNVPPIGRPSTGGAVAGRTVSGGRIEKTPDGRGKYQGSDGRTTAKLQGARLTEVRRANTVVTRPGGGPRTVVVHRPDNRVVVVHGAGHGYVQRSLTVGRHSYYQRTYYAHGRPYARAYQPYFYHGVELYAYAPASYYPMAFYGWAMGPWDPLDYQWGWGGNPWFTYYGPFFRPYAIYRSPSLWLTDFLVSSTLQAAYLAHRDDPGAAPEESLDGSAPMSDDVKGMIADEVRTQLAEEQAEGAALASDPPPPPADSLPPAFSGAGPHIFVVSDALEVENTAGGPCQIREGDAVQLNGPPASGASAQVRVMASKGSDCPAGTTVSVPLPDLVEMSNNMRANIEQGLQTLRDNQGANNLPHLPEAAAANPTMTRFAAQLEPDRDAAGMIQEESRHADQLEQEVHADMGGGPLPNAVPQPPEQSDETRRLASVQTGQTESQVVAIMGQPMTTSFQSGLRKVYGYQAGKVFFTDGNVSGVDRAGSVGSAQAFNPPRAASMGNQPLGAPGRTVTVGQPETEVIAVLGQPLHVTFLGGLKKMYEYRDLKVVFVDGNVSEVQPQ